MLRFRRVYVTGCAERSFPPVIRQDPLLLDDERERINRGAGSMTATCRSRAGGSTRSGCCSNWPVRPPASTSPSPIRGAAPVPPTCASRRAFLLEEVGDLAGGFLSAEALERNAGDWYQRMPARIGYDGAGADDALRALDESDLRWHVLEQGGGQPAVPAIEPLWRTIDAVRAHQAARRKAQLRALRRHRAGPTRSRPRHAGARPDRHRPGGLRGVPVPLLSLPGAGHPRPRRAGADAADRSVAARQPSPCDPRRNGAAVR